MSVSNQGRPSHGVNGVHHIYLVGSGKGGVGKSVITVNIAAALFQRGNRVGILDADIFGPSIPVLLGIGGVQLGRSGRWMVPVQASGIQVVSMGNLVPGKSAVTLRGKEAVRMVRRLIRQVDWGGLDFLIVDLPSGTNEISATLAEESDPDGAVIISTPDKAAREDVHRCISMFEQQGIPIVGLVENMVALACENCGHVESFYTGITDRWCHIETIAVLPVDRSIWSRSKKGGPMVFGALGSDLRQTFDRIAALLEYDSGRLGKMSY